MVKNLLRKKFLIVILLGLFWAPQVQAQATPKYYRTKNSGAWNNNANWESSVDNITWNNATLSPAASDYEISIRPTHIVTVSTSISLDETTIGGIVQVLPGGVLNINNGAGDDIIISNNGVLQILTADNYSSAILPASLAGINIATGGKIEIGNGTAVGSGYETFATNTNNKWQDASTFEWNSTTLFPLNGNVKYFPNAVSEIPNFLVSSTTTPLNVTTASINGLFVVNTDLTLSSTSGATTFKNGLSGNATLTLTGAGSYTLMAPTAIIGGSLTLKLLQDIHLNTGVTIPPGASVHIMGTYPKNIVKGTNGIFLVDGIADMDSTNILNSNGSLTVNGILKTSGSKGLYGTSNSIVANGAVILNPNSTIEYNRSGDQSVQGAALPSYYNVTFSGSGTKTLQSNNNPTGIITVSGAAIFDAQNFTFGTVATKLTMTGTSRYINGGSTTKPDAQGAYTLGNNTTIEFTNSSGVIIRLGLSPLFYANIEISGTDVSNSSAITGIKFKPGGTFTVKNRGIFKLHNSSGFTGGVSTAIDNTNSPTVILEDGSTVEYSGANQAITNQAGLPYFHLSIAGSGNKTAPSGILTVQGNLTKSGTSVFVPNGGTVLLNGTTAQNFAGLTYNNLMLTNGNKITLGSSTILDSIKVNAATTLNVSAPDTIIIHSDGMKTGRVAEVSGSITNTSMFTVERFISAKRAWRFLAVATLPAQSIKNAWQEGAVNVSSNPKPGYGTQLLTNNANWLANGFDAQSINGPSIKTYDYTTDTYKPVASTLNPFDVALGGYMTFIGGDRTATYFGAPVTNTVLRTTGNLFIGNQSVINVLSGKIIPVNNPYASPLDLRKLSSSYNIFYYVWDPNRGGNFGLGAFQTFSWNGITYDVVPGGGSYGLPNNFIESGQAFFVSTLGIDTAIQITESAKASTVPVIIPFVPATASMQLRINLYTLNSDATTTLSDGVLAAFANNYSNNIDGMDAKKLTNFGENLSLNSHNALLTVERKPLALTGDTIFLNLAGTQLKQYRFELVGDNLDQAGFTAYLEDTYLNKRDSLNLNGTTLTDFAIDPNIQSAAADRFRIVFNASEAGPLPVTLTNVKAYKKNENVSVEWQTANEIEVKQYDVEKSADGNLFVYNATITAHNAPYNIYTWLDENALSGYNNYRLKIIHADGQVKFSKIVKVLMPERPSSITAFPNPVKDGIIHFQFVNQPTGIYRLTLINKLGQVLLRKEISHVAGTAIESISVNDKEMTHGTYNLEIMRPDRRKIVKKILY